MLLALTAVQEPLSLWLLPHFLVAAVGVLVFASWKFPKRKYRFSLRGLLAAITLFALFLAAMRDDVLWYLEHWDLVATVRFWFPGMFVSMSMALVASLLVCQFCWIIYANSRDPAN